MSAVTLCLPLGEAFVDVTADISPYEPGDAEQPAVLADADLESASIGGQAVPLSAFSEETLVSWIERFIEVACTPPRQRDLRQHGYIGGGEFTETEGGAA